MKINFNGHIETTALNNLNDFLSDKHLLEKGGIAVAVNEAVIPKPNWQSTPLNNGDKVLVIIATQGG